MEDRDGVLSPSELSQMVVSLRGLLRGRSDGRRAVGVVALMEGVATVVEARGVVEDIAAEKWLEPQWPEPC